MLLPALTSLLMVEMMTDRACMSELRSSGRMLTRSEMRAAPSVLPKRRGGSDRLSGKNSSNCMEKQHVRELDGVVLGLSFGKG